jgi:RNA polymerase sigma factor for flagellar operon FliA
MDIAELFLDNLELIDQVIDRVCRRAMLRGADADDFASQVKLALIDHDYAILRKWNGGSLAAYLAIVMQRLLIDEWRSRFRWVPSAEARRLGPAAMSLEALLMRDCRPLAEAVQNVRTLHPSVSVAELERIASALPRRDPPPRITAMPENVTEIFAARNGTDEREVERVSDRASRLVRDALAAMTLDDRMLLRFRFASSMTIADIARAMGKPQRPLYRRLESLLATLKERLAREGLDAAVLADVIGAPAARIDFGWKNDEMLPSSIAEMVGTTGEHET